ncbi:hypothetical protein ESCO_006068 [Escovopsis weberi]|uniref:Uncharacterized protein n=1 Tax=Escovopsis weberi TaxID=150374 RepID=A0A0M8N037_ESCWE|nr:hypothetical protein ESCO_006068 [Escovopsis weberi]
MPRPPRRARPTPAPAQASRAPPRSPSSDAGSNDGRGRIKTRIAGKLSAEEDNLIRAANRNRDAALERLANKDATTGSSGNEHDGSPGTATPGHRRDASGLDLADDSIFGDLDDSFADAGMPEGLRSTDTSVLSMSNFRGRSRQSSFIGRNDPPIRPSSRGGTTPGIGSSFNIGAFRRRAREPSILGASRKPLREPSGGGGTRAARARSKSESGSAPESEGEEDFEIEPEAESTPVNHRRKTRQSLELRRSAAAVESPGVSSSSPRKRKSEDAHHGRVRPEKTPRTGEPEGEKGEESDSELSDVQSPQQQPCDSDSELSDISSPQEPPGFMRRPATPMQMDDDDDDDEVNAPPASSGSEGGDDVWPDIHGLAKKRRRPSVTTPTRADNASDISSPPSLTHSPNFEDARAKAARGRSTLRQQQQQASPKLTTAELTNLLPKRKYKKAARPLGAESDEELDAAGLGDKDDDLSHLDAQAAQRSMGSRPPSRATSALPGSRGGRAPKGRQGQHSRSGSDKENEHGSAREARGVGNRDEDGDGDAEGESRFVPLADDTFDDGAGPSKEVMTAEELRQASRKFKEVDKWELDFEEVNQASSPQDGR